MAPVKKKTYLECRIDTNMSSNLDMENGKSLRSVLLFVTLC